MTQKEIYDLEKTNKDRIYLYREGIFWKAYERSAFYLSGPGGKLKPTKKFIKSVGDSIISVGFPCAVENGHIDAEDILQREEKAIMIKAKSNNDPEGFQIWKDAVAIHVTTREQNVMGEATEGGQGEESVAMSETEQIVAILRGFNIESHTPLESMMCLSHLRSIATGIEQMRYG